MDRRPIGVFDSGLGGLTAMSKLMEIMPHEDIIYLGDTGRVPYGGRSQETIIKYARQDIEFLKGFDIKAIVVACGTVSTVALPFIERDYDLPIFGVVEPTAKRAAESTANGKVGIIATEASIRSGAYARCLLSCRGDIEVYSQPCPLFVPLVENGHTKRGDIVIETVAAEYLEPMKAAGIDTLILGCTHYPLLTDVINDFFGGGVKLINSGGETAVRVWNELKNRKLMNDSGHRGRYHYFVSDSVSSFERLASAFLQRDICGDVQKVDLSIY